MELCVPSRYWSKVQVFDCGFRWRSRVGTKYWKSSQVLRKWFVSSHSRAGDGNRTCRQFTKSRWISWPYTPRRPYLGI